MIFGVLLYLLYLVVIHGESYEHLMEMVTEAVEGWLEVAKG